MNTLRPVYYLSVCVFVAFCIDQAGGSFTDGGPTFAHGGVRESGTRLLNPPAYPQETTAPDANELAVKVVSVRGIAKKMQANVANSRWTALKANETLGQYAVVRTGLNSQVLLHFADRGQVTIESGTKVGIAEFISMKDEKGTVKARLGLKYGSMRLKVDRSRGESDFSVATAVATLSVRGTDGWLAFFGDLGLFLRGMAGTFEIVKGDKKHKVKGDQWGDGSLNPSADNKTKKRYVNMSDPSGSTPGEQMFLARNDTGRVITNFVNRAGRFLNSLFSPSSSYNSRGSYSPSGSNNPPSPPSETDY